MVPVVTAPSVDTIVSFHLASGVFRGRLVRAGGVVSDMVAAHDYPPVAEAVFAETVSLAVALAAGIKYDGLFTLQLQGSGAIRTMVVDVQSDGAVRGVMRCDEAADWAALTRMAALAQPPTDTPFASQGPAGADAPSAPSLRDAQAALFSRLIGDGTMAFTVDQGPDTQRYQGVVALDGTSISECVEAYFRQSEQLPTRVLAATDTTTGKARQSVCLLLQRMPQEAGGQDGEDWDESWNRATILASSLTSAELLDPELDAHGLLRRPFHAESLEITHYAPLYFRCRCSREKVETTLNSFPADQIAEMAENNVIEVTCEFCKALYTFDINTLHKA